MSEEKSGDGYGRLQRRLQFHLDGASRRQRWWNVLALSLQFSLPVLSGVLTIIAADRSGLSGPEGQAAVFWIGGVLTLLTGLNSTLQPSKKEVFYSQYANRFMALRDELELELLALSNAHGEGSKECQRESLELLRRMSPDITRLIDGYNSGQSLSADAKAAPGAHAEQR